MIQAFTRAHDSGFRASAEPLVAQLEGVDPALEVLDLAINARSFANSCGVSHLA